MFFVEEGKESGEKDQQSIAGANINKIQNTARINVNFAGQTAIVLHLLMMKESFRMLSAEKADILNFLCKGKHEKKPDDKKGEVKEIEA